eukprot:COSAG05_NODE_2268_length_3305_cov_7.375546_4_plen_71_part_00
MKDHNAMASPGPYSRACTSTSAQTREARPALLLATTLAAPVVRQNQALDVVRPRGDQGAHLGLVPLGVVV